jgi:UDP-GlcNAc3NAcA epimerase
VTEWVESVEEGFNILVDSNKDKIIDAIKNFEIKGKNKAIYGDGDTSKKIVEKILKLENN